MPRARAFIAWRVCDRAGKSSYTHNARIYLFFLDGFLSSFILVRMNIITIDERTKHRAGGTRARTRVYALYRSNVASNPDLARPIAHHRGSSRFDRSRSQPDTYTYTSIRFTFYSGGVFFCARHNIISYCAPFDFEFSSECPDASVRGPNVRFTARIAPAVDRNLRRDNNKCIVKTHPCCRVVHDARGAGTVCTCSGCDDVHTVSAARTLGMGPQNCPERSGF